MRTIIQHAWATAVEIVSIRHKEGSGESNLNKLLVQVADVFETLDASEEIQNSDSISIDPFHPNADSTEIFLQAIKNNIDKSVIEEINGNHMLPTLYSMLRGLEDIMERSQHPVYGHHGKNRYYLIEGRRIPGDGRMAGGYVGGSFKEKHEAIFEYNTKEELYSGNPDVNIVLVYGEDIEKLKKSFPNYFGNCATFQRILSLITGR